MIHCTESSVRKKLRCLWVRCKTKITLFGSSNLVNKTVSLQPRVQTFGFNHFSLTACSLCLLIMSDDLLSGRWDQHKHMSLYQFGHYRCKYFLVEDSRYLQLVQLSTQYRKHILTRTETFFRNLSGKKLKQSNSFEERTKILCTLKNFSFRATTTLLH